jgi:hypothetical protein
MAEAQKMTINVAGRCDYTVGMVVEVTMYQNKPVQKKDTQDMLIDKILSGKYLVAAINHTITIEGHVCAMELIKDSSIKEL